MKLLHKKYVGRLENSRTRKPDTTFTNGVKRSVTKVERKSKSEKESFQQ